MTGSCTRWERWLPVSGGMFKVLNWNLHSFRFLEIIQVLDSISWVRCASGNVFSVRCSLALSDIHSGLLPLVSVGDLDLHNVSELYLIPKATNVKLSAYPDGLGHIFREKVPHG